MGQKIVLGAPFDKGLRNDVTAFNIDENAFATLINAYQWRGRVKRKRGTALLGRLQRQFTTLSIGNSAASPWTFTLFSFITPSISVSQPYANVVLKSVSIVIGAITFTDNGDGTLSSVTGGNSGTINYLTSSVTLTTTAIAGTAATATFAYYPMLPVMGLEDLELIPTQFPGKIAFDTTYAYDIATAYPYPVTDVSFYKNPGASASLPGYTPKTTLTPLIWNGKNYQQFWSNNSQNSLFVTNGIQIPFNSNNVGMQYKAITTVTVTAGGPPAIATLTITGHALVVGDFVFVNEVATTTGINFQTGYVINVIDANNVSVEFPNATIAGNGTGGIAQYLTNTAISTVDPIRFYDGSPASGGVGWVNFSPPLSQSNFSVAQLPPAQYYLVSARMIIDFKDRLLFLGCVVQNSTGGKFYLQDTIIYSQNGTPYYTASFTGAVNASNTVFNPILVPLNQTATASAYFEDDTGFGGFISAGLSQPLTTVASNEDVLIAGFSMTKVRIVSTGNDLVPFVFYIINSEYGDASTFSTINLDRNILSRGTRGYLGANQNEVIRIDPLIPDQVFQIDLTDNGNERFTAGRNFLLEWVYFTYNSNNSSEGLTNTAVFPNQSLFYNYRDGSWAIFNESYTTYGNFRRQTGFTWATIGTVFGTWDNWNQPWNSGSSTLLQQELIAGNQQGFVVSRDIGTNEATTLIIYSFSNATNIVTSPDHNLNNNDYVIISGSLGTVGTLVNGKIFQIFNATRNTFQLSPDPGITTETYLGGGLMTLIYVPFIQTKQFPLAWDMARKTRLGTQQYLFTGTYEGEVTLQIYLSQNADSPYNAPYQNPQPKPPNPPAPNVPSINDALIYSQILYTCPESTNLGLTQANSSLQMITVPPTGASPQAQIWHRINTSLIGDTVQIGITLSDAQIRDLYTIGLFYTITNATQAIQCVLTVVGQFSGGQIVEINGVIGMDELNGNQYTVISYIGTQLTINVNSTLFNSYISGGTATVVTGVNAFAEIEMHGMILDCSPSQLLS